MPRWIEMLAGLIVWAIHFGGVYAIASIGAVVSRADDPVWRAAGLIFSLACAAAAGLLLIRALQKPAPSVELDRFMTAVARVGALLALVAIVWQALPAAIV